MMLAKVALFTLGGHGFALAVAQIDQIVSGARIFALPLLPVGIFGVILSRDEAIPLIDPRGEPGLPAPGGPVAAEYVVVLQTEMGKVGLQADKVLRIVGREQGKIEEADGSEQDACAGRRFVFGGMRYPFPDVESFIVTLTDRTHPGVSAEEAKED